MTPRESRCPASCCLLLLLELEAPVLLQIEKQRRGDRAARAFFPQAREPTSLLRRFDTYWGLVHGQMSVACPPNQGAIIGSQQATPHKQSPRCSSSIPSAQQQAHARPRLSPTWAASVLLDPVLLAALPWPIDSIVNQWSNPLGTLHTRRQRERPARAGGHGGECGQPASPVPTTPKAELIDWSDRSSKGFGSRPLQGQAHRQTATRCVGAVMMVTAVGRRVAWGGEEGGGRHRGRVGLVALVPMCPPRMP